MITKTDMQKRMTAEKKKKIKRAMRFTKLMEQVWIALQVADDFIEGSEPVRELQEKVDTVTEQVCKAILRS